MFQMKSKNKKQCAAISRIEKGANDIIETPEWLAQTMCIKSFNSIIDVGINTKKISILDPCAGLEHRLTKHFQTDIILPHIRKNITITELEIRLGTNFFDLPYWQKYDIIIMNPPFSNLGAWKFIEKSMEHLKTFGSVVSIVPDYILFNSEKRKRQLDSILYKYYALPKNAFGFPLHTFLVICKDPEYIDIKNKYFIFDDN